MGEQVFADRIKTDLPDKHFSVHSNARSLDADQFGLDATLHYHDKCMGVQRVSDFYDWSKAMINARLMQSVMMLGTEFHSGAEVAAKAQDPKGLAEMQDKINEPLKTILGNMCLESDGVAITRIKTTDHP